MLQNIVSRSISTAVHVRWLVKQQNGRYYHTVHPDTSWCQKFEGFDIHIQGALTEPQKMSIRAKKEMYDTVLFG